VNTSAQATADHLGRFAGRVALVTGGSRGIGLETARRLVGEGARVCVTARHDDALRAAVAELGGPTVALGVPGRADDEGHQQDTVDRVLDTWGRLDVLVNNAAVNPVHGPLASLEDRAVRKVLDVNLVAPLQWTRRAMTGWMETNGGCVVNVASLSGLLPSASIGWYGVTKAGLVQLTRQLALELSPLVRVNAVAPALVETRFSGGLYGAEREAEVARYPLGRAGRPGDVAAAIAYLASDDASWVTGQTISLDGGLLLTGGA
jgi:NAD(P)-dependent dehydrogenase (short-subunit alcohol dehydrogenase family)